MPVIRIEEPTDPRVADYRDVRDSELFRSRGLFVAEGRLVVRRLLEDRRFVVRSLLVNDAAYRALADDISTQLSNDVPVYVCGKEHFPAVTGFDLHRGCLALAKRPAERSLDDLLNRARLIVVLEGVTNADNVGGVFRNAAAFGADVVLLSPTCCDPFYRKAIRTSMAATLRVPFARIADWPKGLVTLGRSGWTLVALTLRETAETLDEFLLAGRPERVALLVGTEGIGLSDGVQAAADRLVRIPIRSEVDSLNLAVATAIVLARFNAVS